MSDGAHVHLLDPNDTAPIAAVLLELEHTVAKADQPPRNPRAVPQHQRAVDHRGRPEHRPRTRCPTLSRTTVSYGPPMRALTRLTDASRRPYPPYPPDGPRSLASSVWTSLDGSCQPVGPAQTPSVLAWCIGRKGIVRRPERRRCRAEPGKRQDWLADASRFLPEPRCLAHRQPFRPPVVGQQASRAVGHRRPAGARPRRRYPPTARDSPRAPASRAARPRRPCGAGSRRTSGTASPAESNTAGRWPSGPARPPACGRRTGNGMRSIPTIDT